MSVPPAPSGPSFAERVGQLEERLTEYSYVRSLDTEVSLLGDLLQCIHEQQAALTNLADSLEQTVSATTRSGAVYESYADARAVLAKYRIE